jgi:Flp pilus assembly protein TadB
VSVWLELVLLLAALAATAVLGTDLVRRRMDRSRERRHLERLESGAEDDPQASPEVGGVARRLRAAGAPIGPLPYLAGSALLAAGAFFVTLSGFGGRPVVALGVAVIAVWVPWGLLGSWALRRSRRFEEKLVDAVGYMTSALQAGDNPSGALATAGESAEAPTGPELRRVADRLAAGMSVRQAL